GQRKILFEILPHDIGLRVDEPHVQVALEHDQDSLHGGVRRERFGNLTSRRTSRSKCPASPCRQQIANEVTASHANHSSTPPAETQRHRSRLPSLRLPPAPSRRMQN